jgi:4-hydroxybenzoyl-CoA reductase subunit beta
MLRLPYFRFLSPQTIDEAADALASGGGDAAIVAGGTDLLPNMKRRQQTPGILVSVRRIAELRRIADASAAFGDGGLTIGAGMTLTGIVRALRMRGTPAFVGLAQAAAQVATPQLRNMGTIGGNLCLDTRCNYYDQSYEWRKAIDFCMKKDGGICWVAPSSTRCLAVSSTDTAPALMSLGAVVTLASADGVRTLPLTDLYRNDGIDYLARRPSEILTTVELPPLRGWRSTYWKLRRRGSFDFPVLSVAAAAQIAPDGTVGAARIVLGAVASRPIDVPRAADALAGRALSDAAIASAAELAAQPAKPMDNTDFSLVWRKRMTRELVAHALRELRGDDMRDCRRRVARQLL